MQDGVEPRARPTIRMRWWASPEARQHPTQSPYFHKWEQGVENEPNRISEQSHLKFCQRGELKVWSWTIGPSAIRKPEVVGIQGVLTAPASRLDLAAGFVDFSSRLERPGLDVLGDPRQDAARSRTGLGPDLEPHLGRALPRRFTIRTNPRRDRVSTEESVVTRPRSTDQRMDRRKGERIGLAMGSWLVLRGVSPC